MRYAVVFEQGAVSVGASVPDLPGCFGVGRILEEARERIASAIEFHIRCLRQDGDEVPQPVSCAEVAAVAA